MDCLDLALGCCGKSAVANRQRSRSTSSGAIPPTEIGKPSENVFIQLDEEDPEAKSQLRRLGSHSDDVDRPASDLDAPPTIYGATDGHSISLAGSSGRRSRLP